MEVKSGEYEISNMEASYANANRPLTIRLLLQYVTSDFDNVSENWCWYVL
jgi:hypothetical protein